MNLLVTVDLMAFSSTLILVAPFVIIVVLLLLTKTTVRASAPKTSYHRLVYCNIIGPEHVLEVQCRLQ